MAIFPPKLTLFLSTPSARRATLAIRAFGGYDDISIHALREEGDLRNAIAVQQYYISIHALREEGDAKLAQCP